MTYNRGARGGRPRRPYMPRRRACSFCVTKVDIVNYKDVTLLSRFISDRAKIDSRRKTGTCAKHQRRLARAIKRARELAFLPFTSSHVQTTGWISPTTRSRPRSAPPA